MSRWMRLGGVASIAAVVWVLAAGLGGYRLLSEVPGRVTEDRGAEDAHRNSVWSPIYGFADVCQTKIAPEASVLLIDPTGAALQVPASQQTGPAAFGLPADLDWPNQAVFAYVLYPRPVSAIGHVPADQGMLASAAYIAVWEQGSFRSQEATAAAQRAEAGLRSGLGAQEVCAYTGGGGDRGVIFRAAATSVPAVAATHEPPPFPGGRAGAYARVLVGLGSLWLLGLLLVRMVAGRALSLLLRSAVALPLGCLGASLQLLAYSLVGLAWSGPALAAPWLVVGALVLWKDRHEALALLRRISWRMPAQIWHGLAWMDRVAILGLAGIGLVITASAPLGLPWSDGFNLYYFKARAFFNDGSVIPYYQHAHEMLFSFPAHPPLVPLSVTWLYLFLGEVDEHASLLLWPAFYLSMLGGFYAFIRTALARSTALWYTVALALVAYELSTQAMLGSFADLPVAVFLLFACGLFWAWAATEQQPRRMLALAGVALAAAALTKEEGLVAAPVFLAATPLLLWSRRWSRRLWLPVAISLPIVAVIAGFWLWLRTRYDLPELTVHLGGNLSVILHRLPAALTGLGARAILPLVPFLALTAALVLIRSKVDWRRSVSGRFWFVAAVVTVLLGADVAAIAAAPVEVHHQVAIAATRLVSQVLALVFLGFAEVWALVVDHARARASNVAEGSHRPATTAPVPSTTEGA